VPAPSSLLGDVERLKRLGIVINGRHL
jgi:hypothetical protein